MTNALRIAQTITGQAEALLRNADELVVALAGTAPDLVPYTDRIAEMPTNPAPFHADFVRNFPGMTVWPMRSDEVAGVTIHHTLSHSPVATARYCTMTKGYPTTQYHYWISAGDGCPAWRLVAPSQALWHDHTGRDPVTLSVGMAGSLHINKPPREQIESAARLVAWLMGEYGVPVSEVQGHCDRHVTICPGWNWKPETKWRDEFFDVLNSITGA